MDEKIRDIVSVFIKVPSDQIGPATAIGRTAVKSSILLHRMYARLQEEGIVVDNYSEIRTFSELLGRSRDNGELQQSGESAAMASFQPGGSDIGIDVEEIAAMPIAHDFRKDEFYIMNFTPSEIAYCILQPDPYASFAGLFSAKEAIVKADGRHRSRSFNTIGITHDPEGRPLYPGVHLSISHAGGVAIAVAVPSKAERTQPAPPQLPSAGQSKGASWVGWVALLLSILAIILGFTR